MSERKVSTKELVAIRCFALWMWKCTPAMVHTIISLTQGERTIPELAGGARTSEQPFYTATQRLLRSGYLTRRMGSRKGIGRGRGCYLYALTPAGLDIVKGLDITKLA